MGEANKGPLGSHHCKRLSFTPSPLAKPQAGASAVQSGFGAGRGFEKRNFRLSGKRRSSSCAQEPGASSQPSFCGAQKRRRVAPDHRFEAPESVFKPTSLQDGGTVHGSFHSTEGFLSGQDRPKGCISHSASGRRFPIPVGIPRQPGRVSAVPNPPIRALHRSLHIHEVNKASNQVSEAGGHTDYSLFRRHAASSSVRRPAVPRFINYPLASHSIGVHSKPHKISAHPSETTGISWFSNRYPEYDHSPTTCQSHRPSEGGRKITGAAYSFNQVLGTTCREVGGNETSSFYSATKVPGTSEPEDIIDFCPARADIVVTGGLQRVEMVEHSAPSTLFCTTAEARGIPSDNVRCVNTGMGRRVSRSEDRGQMDSERDPVSYQYSRTESSLSCNPVFPEGAGSSEHSGQTGQPSSDCLSQQDGEYFTDPSLPACHSGMGLVFSPPYYFTGRISSRCTEYNCRLGIEAPSGQQRLAAMSLSVRHPELPAGSILNRFICLQNEPPATYILQLEARPRCLHNRRILNFLDQNDSLSLSSILFSRESSIEDTQRVSQLCLPDSTCLASTALVPSAAVNVVRLPDFAPRGPRLITRCESPTQSPPGGREVVPDRLAYLRQTYEAQGFSQRVIRLVIESWRGNTNTAYNSAWRKWHSWCLRRSINPISASVADIMEFLTDQFDSGLQYRTINTIRSSISTTHPDIDGTAVGTHPLVSRLMKGMFNCRPPAPRYNNSWDIESVVGFLNNSYKSSTLTVLQLAKKAVTLLAITNADRCSDLAALDRNHLKQTPVGVEFTVVQLTKTRSRKSSAPRKVFYHCFAENPEICPVTVLQLYIQRTAGQVATMSPKPVFVTSRRPIHRAKPGTIGHWIKDTLRLAGVNTEAFSAHSTRSASTSHAATKGVPICDILRAANWSSSSTFERFYYRPTVSDNFQRAILQSNEETRYKCFDDML